MENNRIALAYCAPFQDRARSTVEDAFQDIMQELTTDDPESKLLINFTSSQDY